MILVLDPGGAFGVLSVTLDSGDEKPLAEATYVVRRS